MTTNLQNNTISRVPSLKFQDLYKSFNRNANFVTSALVKHKEGYRETPKETINKAALNGKLTQTNNTPLPIKEEINQLAKAWCELLLGQIQENTINRN